MTRRVLYVNHNPLGSASTYRQVGLAKYLSREGFECIFLGRSRRKFGTSSEAGGREWSAFRKKSYWQEPLVRKAFSNVRLYRNEAIASDIVYVNRAYPFTAGIMSLGDARRRLVVDMEDWDGFGGYSSYAGLYDPRGVLLTLPELIFPRRADLVLVVSRLLLSVMGARGVKNPRLLYLPNGVDDELFDRLISRRDARESLGIGSGPVVMYSSTFWSWEQELHETALRTFRAVAARVPDVKFLMTGAGEFSFRQKIEGLGLADKVRFVGYVPREDVPKYMAAADMAVHVISGHPFHLASSPMVVPEYMAMGKAVVAPGLGELTSLLGEGAGVLVGRPSPERLSEAVVSLLRDDALRSEIGEKAHRLAMEQYSYRVLAGRLAQALSLLEV